MTEEFPIDDVLRVQSTLAYFQKRVRAAEQGEGERKPRYRAELPDAVVGTAPIRTLLRQAWHFGRSVEEHVSLALQQLDKEDHLALKALMYREYRPNVTIFPRAMMKLEDVGFRSKPTPSCFTSLVDRRPCSTTGLMGCIGSGKSTLLRMLAISNAVAGNKTVLWSVEDSTMASLLNKITNMVQDETVQDKSKLTNNLKLFAGPNSPEIVAFQVPRAQVVIVDYLMLLSRYYGSRKTISVYGIRDYLNSLPQRLRSLFPAATLILAHQLNAAANDKLPGAEFSRSEGMETRVLWPSHAEVFMIGSGGRGNTRALRDEGGGVAILRLTGGYPEDVTNKHVIVEARIIPIPEFRIGTMQTERKCN